MAGIGWQTYAPAIIRFYQDEQCHRVADLACGPASQRFAAADADWSGKSRELAIDESGKVVEVEQGVSLEALPPAALTAIQAGAEGATIAKVEEVKSDSETVHEAQVHSSGKRQEIRVHADGSPAPEQD